MSTPAKATRRSSRAAAAAATDASPDASPVSSHPIREEPSPGGPPSVKKQSKNGSSGGPSGSPTAVVLLAVVLVAGGIAYNRLVLQPAEEAASAAGVPGTHRSTLEQGAEAPPLPAMSAEEVAVFERVGVWAGGLGGASRGCGPRSAWLAAPAGGPHVPGGSLPWHTREAPGPSEALPVQAAEEHYGLPPGYQTPEFVPEQDPPPSNYEEVRWPGSGAAWLAALAAPHVRRPPVCLPTPAPAAPAAAGVFGGCGPRPGCRGPGGGAGRGGAGRGGGGWRAADEPRGRGGGSGSCCRI